MHDVVVVAVDSTLTETVCLYFFTTELSRVAKQNAIESFDVMMNARQSQKATTVRNIAVTSINLSSLQQLLVTASNFLGHEKIHNWSVNAGMLQMNACLHSAASDCC